MSWILPVLSALTNSVNSSASSNSSVSSSSSSSLSNSSAPIVPSNSNGTLSSSPPLAGSFQTNGTAPQTTLDATSPIAAASQQAVPVMASSPAAVVSSPKPAPSAPLANTVAHLGVASSPSVKPSPSSAAAQSPKPSPPPPKVVSTPAPAPAPQTTSHTTTANAPAKSAPAPAPSPSAPSPSAPASAASSAPSLAIDTSITKESSLEIPKVSTPPSTHLPVSSASAPISFTISQNGHQVVTTPASFTTTLPTVINGTPTSVPVIVANPVPSNGALSGESNLTKSSTFMSNKGLSAGVFTVVGLAILAIFAFLFIRVRRKKQARRRAYTQAAYTNIMAQRRSFFDPTIPSFDEIPRPPPPIPNQHRRPAPQFRLDSSGTENSLTPLTLGSTTVHLPGNEFAGFNTWTRYSPPSTALSPSSSVNPFDEPSLKSGLSELPLLNRTLRTSPSSLEGRDSGNSSSVGHGNSGFEPTRSPSPTPSTPSIYPPTLPALDDGFVLNSARPSMSEERPAVNLGGHGVPPTFHPSNPFVNVSSPLAK